MKWQTLFAFSTATYAHSLRQRALQCQDITIPVDVSTQAGNLTSMVAINALVDAANLSNWLASGSVAANSTRYNIAARYCEPTVDVASRRRTLQLLVHGITYNRDYWSGLAPPGTKAGQDQYSWIVYAANQGYPTLSIDRLCNGKSDRPNGLLACQLPLQVETIHAIVTSARNGQLPNVGKSFDKLLYIGHSYGSLVGNGLSVQYPADANGLILSGYSTRANNSGLAVPLLQAYLPAAIVSPLKYGYLVLDLSYLQPTSRQGTKTVFYYGDYDEAIFSYDFDNRGTVTLGEASSSSAGTKPAPNYTGPLFVLNGNQDGLFCEDSPSQALAGTPGNCSKPEFSAGVRSNYPAASSFGFHNTPNTGHCLNLHRTAQESFKAAHDFLTQVGF